MDFTKFKDLTPQAFKLYACLRHLSHTQNTTALTLSLAQLGTESGLQAFCPYPALRHGKDGQLRRALSELIRKGLIEKRGQRGRRPNTYILGYPDDAPDNHNLII